jgi:two-component system chemotaxis sensor kinase CheA
MSERQALVGELPGPRSGNGDGDRIVAPSGSGGGWVLATTAGEPAGPGPALSPDASADRTIPVDAGVLDNLMALVGELVLARNELLQLVAAQPDGLLTAAAQRLSLIATGLQEAAMQARMRPFSAVAGGFPALVAELSRSSGKQLRLEVEGEDTELDTSTIDAVSDPLTLLIRHAVDHGIESTAERLAAAKPAVARIGVRAFLEGGRVTIEISDDGAGADPHPGGAAAPTTGAVEAAGAAIERIGGSVEVRSVPGRGTTSVIKLPLTLAVVPALFVASAGERFAIPQADVVELVRVAAGEQHRIERFQGAPVYRRRGHLLPLIPLRRQLGQPGADATTEPATVTIVVVQVDEHQVGLMVEGVSDAAEIVVKPLGPHLRAIAAYAGATIMADGSVALILDVRGLADQAGIFTDHDEPATTGLLADADADADADAGHRPATDPLLLLSTAAGGRMAVALSAVDRLERFPCSAVERVGSQDVVQYRDALLPLVFAERGAGDRRARTGATGSIQVVVFELGGRRRGLVVDRVLDIVDEPVPLQGTGRVGVLGSMVIDGRATEVLDVPALLQAAGLSDHDASTRGA